MSINSIYEKAYKGDYNQVKLQIDQNENIIHAPDESVVYDVVKLLKESKDATVDGNENLVEFLIDKGSPINCIDDSNNSPLILAASAGRYEVVRLLIGRGSNINLKTNSGQSALHYVCSKGHIEIAKLLLQSGANVNETDVLNATPLHRAAAQGRSNIVELLLSYSQINIDTCDSTGSTPLHLACEEEREPVACMLVKAGANVHITNKEEKTSIDLCSPRLKKTLISLLE